MDYLLLVKYTEHEINKAKSLPSNCSEKNTTALWMNLNHEFDVSKPSLLELHQVTQEQDWQNMLNLRAKVESQFGISDQNSLNLMIEQIKICQKKLNAQWYLANLIDSNAIVGEVGLVKFTLNGLSIGRLQDVDIEPAYQGKGLGDELLSSIIKESLSLGLQAICLKADSEDWPLEWYKRRGFTAVGEWMS